MLKYRLHFFRYIENTGNAPMGHLDFPDLNTMRAFPAYSTKSSTNFNTIECVAVRDYNGRWVWVEMSSLLLAHDQIMEDKLGRKLGCWDPLAESDEDDRMIPTKKAGNGPAETTADDMHF